MNPKKEKEQETILHAKRIAEEKGIEHGFFEELFEKIVKYVRKE